MIWLSESEISLLAWSLTLEYLLYGSSFYQSIGILLGTCFEVKKQFQYSWISVDTESIIQEFQVYYIKTKMICAVSKIDICMNCKVSQHTQLVLLTNSKSRWFCVGDQNFTAFLILAGTWRLDVQLVWVTNHTSSSAALMVMGQKLFTMGRKLCTASLSDHSRFRKWIYHQINAVITYCHLLYCFVTAR